MGTQYTMTIAEAARVLGRSERTIRNYINSGQLSSQQAGRGRNLDPEEVHELLTEGMSERPKLAEIRTLRAKVRRIEAQMAVVQRILDLRDAKLGMTPDYAEALVGHLRGQLGRPSGTYTLREMESWADIFGRMDEEDLSVLERAGHGHAWISLLRLSSRMTSEVAAREDYTNSLAAQEIHKLLADARRRLRISCFVYRELQGALPPEFREGVTLKEDLFERLKSPENTP
jgi:excisionase family DNA binding protein